MDEVKDYVAIRCPLCDRDVTDPEDRERLAGVNPFCDRGGNWKENVPGCPYRVRENQ